MAIEVMGEVMTARRAPWKGGDLLVLLFLAGYADPDGTNIYPRVSTLARACRMKERNTRICLKALEEDGVLIKTSAATGAPGKFNEYKIDMERVQSLQGCKVCRGAICGDEGCKKRPRGVQNPVTHIDKRPLPVLDTSCARAAGPVDGPVDARSLWGAVAAKLGNVKFTSNCGKGDPVLKDGRLVVTFPNMFRAERAQNLIEEIERAAGVPVVIRVAA